MARIVAVTGSKVSRAHTMLAAEALKKTARMAGHEIKIEVRPQASLSGDDIAAADVVIVACDDGVDLERFGDKKVLVTTPSELILATAAAVDRAVSLAGFEAEKSPEAKAGGMEHGPRRIVAVTACPTGIAHTFMAAEALRKSAAQLGYEIKVETQGSVGSKNLLSEDEIRDADAVVIAADTHVDTARFAGKRLHRTSTKDALHDGAGVLETALALPEPAAEPAAGTPQRARPARTGAYKHLMTGVSYMLPLVTAGGLLIALAFAIGGVHAGDRTGTLAWALMQIGGGTAFHLYVPVLAAFIAYSIADRPGIAPGLVGGMLATTTGAGFLGGMIAGFLAGYATKVLNDHVVKLPQNLAGLKPVLILPVLSTLIVGLAMIFLVGVPVKAALDGLTAWLNGMQQSSALVLGLLLGAMMGFDMGGPVNKAAYTFSVAILASRVYGPIAATMAAGMTPPLGVALATVLFRNRFTQEERDLGKATAVLGISFITEGAIPYAAKDPLRVIPCLMIGSAVAGGLSMMFGVQLMVPHGGIFVLLIPNAVQRLGQYVVAVAAGTLLTACALRIAKRRQIAAELGGPA
jgi:PTS system fructose-specific IIC component